MGTPGAADDASTATDAVAVPASGPVSALAADPVAAHPRWRDRLWSLRAMIAVAVASLLLGGAGGAGIAAATRDHHGHPHRFGRFGEGPGGMRGPGGFRGGYGGYGGGFGGGFGGAQTGKQSGPGGGVVPPGGAQNVPPAPSTGGTG